MLKDIKNITIEEMIDMSEKGLYFIVRDGAIKGFTNK